MVMILPLGSLKQAWKIPIYASMVFVLQNPNLRAQSKGLNALKNTLNTIMVLRLGLLIYVTARRMLSDSRCQASIPVLLK